MLSTLTEPMPNLARAYEFESPLSQEELTQRLSTAGPWPWSRRESEWYGDYLISRTPEGVRIRIHDRREPFFGSAEREPGPRYKCQLDTSSGDAQTMASVDSTFRDLLRSAGVSGLTAIDVYD